MNFGGYNSLQLTMLQIQYGLTNDDEFKIKREVKDNAKLLSAKNIYF